MMCARTTRRIAALAAGLAAALLASPVAALPAFTYGFDLDPDTSGLNTQAGFQRVSICMFAQGETPSGCLPSIVEFGPAGTGAGYRAGARPFTFVGFTLQATPDAPALWRDGHQVTLGAEAVLRLYGIPAGSYELVLLSHHAAALIDTDFRVDGVDVGGITGDSNATDLLAQQSLTVPVVVGEDGLLDVSFRQGDPTKPGQLNGLLLVPEADAAGLVIVGLGLLGTLGRKPARGASRP